MSFSKMKAEVLIFFMLGVSDVAFAEDNSVQKQIDTVVHVHRDLTAEKSPYRLYIRTGIWQPGGVLYNSKNSEIINFEGYQKGKNIKLLSFDAERGLKESPQYIIEGTIDTTKNSIDVIVTHTNSGIKEKIYFTPEIKVINRPLFNLKFFGREDKEWHRDIIEYIEITDAAKDNKLIQTLTGFSASGSSVDYVDINYDGYFDIVLSNPEITKEEYIYWVYNPLKRIFERNVEIEKIKGYPSRQPWKKQISFFQGNTYQIKNGEFIETSSN